MPNEPIHSGHFMTSNLHSEIPEDEDEDVEVDVVDVDDSTSEAPILEKRSLQDRANKVYRLQEDEKPVTFYKFGPTKTQSIAIDVSLNKLNRCIKVAYMKMTTPKWKDFKGLKLQWKHRIRLNNVIWRAYYMEFRKPDKRKKTPYCYFAVPDDDTTHTKIEGTVLEGMYWKRRMEAVCAQYKRWRTYNRAAKKKKICCRKPENSKCECDLTENKIRPPQSQTPQNLSTMDDYFDFEDFGQDFTNSLFDSLNVPFLFPNPKELMQSNNADFMQPGLLSLQPSLEEIMNADDDTNLDALEPTFSMQQSTGDPRFSAGSRSAQSYNFGATQPMSTLSSPTTPLIGSKDYGSPDTLIDYNQPTRQSSNLPASSLASSILSQPLYSQAVYETRTISSTSSLNESPVGSVGALEVKSAPRSASANLKPVASIANSFDYLPQFIVSASVNTPTPSSSVPMTSMIGAPISNHNSLRSFVMDQSGQLISPQQYWMNNPQIYNLPEEKTLQMLRSPAASTAAQASMLLSLSQAHHCAQPMPTYTASYGFSANNAKTVQPMPQHPSTITSAQQPLAPRPQMPTSTLHFGQQRPMGPHEANLFDAVSNRQPLIDPSNSLRNAHDLSHYLPQSANISTPSASLASILTAGPRADVQNGPQISPVDLNAIGNVKSSFVPFPSSADSVPGRSAWNSQAKRETRSSTTNTPLSEPLSVRTGQLDDQRNHSYGPIGLKPPKQVASAPQSVDYEMTAPVSQPPSNFKRRTSGRRPNPVVLEPPVAVDQELVASTQKDSAGRRSVRGKRTRSQLLPPPSSTPTSAQSTSFSQPPSVQTQLSYNADDDQQSPLNTPKAEASDESFDEFSPSGFSNKRGRYSASCSEAADSTLHPEERKRLLHLNAEKNRREALKDGFDALTQAIPVIEETGLKVTNAVVLNRAAQHIRLLKKRIEEYDKQVAECEKRNELLQKRVSIVQSSLPSNIQQTANGQSSSTISGQVMQFFERYVRERSRDDHRFFVMTSMMKPVVEAFAEQVNVESTEKSALRNATLGWSESQFKVARLRPLATKTLIKIATETNLTNMNSSGAPATLEDYINREVSNMAQYNDGSF
ncbi:Protein WBSCR14-like protein [Aphelenchoides besseyi]|nr:Protein WBSCR14-like protein [Aphelenchoides besseyi]